MAGRFPFPGLPGGWYAAALGAELAPGRLVSRRCFGREIVLYRAASGAVRGVDAHCPHLGAHLGKVGRVEGEGLRCGFHGFVYDGAGRCVATPYGGPPPRARLRAWPVREQNGLVLVWFDPLGRPPAWEVPVLDDARWNGLVWRRQRIPTHPQETTENSVDFGHFTQIHGFVDGAITRPVETRGPLLRTSYRALRPFGLPGLPLVKPAVEYHVNVWGLGYSQVDVVLAGLRMRARVWVLPTPVDEEHIDLVLACSGLRGAGPPARLVRLVVFRVLLREVAQDLDVWSHKVFVERPALAQGDGPIAEYRRWARQFYAPAAEGASPPDPRS